MTSSSPIIRVENFTAAYEGNVLDVIAGGQDRFRDADLWVDATASIFATTGLSEIAAAERKPLGVFFVTDIGRLWP